MAARVLIRSFGWLHGQPDDDAALVVDCRGLVDPHIDPALVGLTGLDDAVVGRVLATPGAASLIAAAAQGVLDRLATDPHTSVVVLVGCQGGRHRAVVVATMIAAALVSAKVRDVEVEHLHVDREVVDR